MTREIDITITMVYDYQPAEPEVGMPDPEITLDEDDLIRQAIEAAWTNETRRAEETHDD